MSMPTKSTSMSLVRGSDTSEITQRTAKIIEQEGSTDICPLTSDNLHSFRRKRSRQLFLAFLFVLMNVCMLHGQSASAIYTIAGTVVSSKSDEPVAGVHLVATESLSGQQLGIATSEGNGRFAITGLPAGKFTLAASKRGYRTVTFNEHSNYSSAIVTGPTQQTDQLIFKLPPSATLMVEVNDEGGDPVEGANVRLFVQNKSHGPGPRISMGFQQETNDQGRVEFVDLYPGHYYIAVEAEPWYSSQNIIGNNPTVQKRVDQNEINPAMNYVYPITFFDGSTDESTAKAIDLTDGRQERVAISLNPVPAVHLSVPAPKEGIKSGIVLQKSVFGLPYGRVNFSPVFDSGNNNDASLGLPKELSFYGLAPGSYVLIEHDSKHKTSLRVNGSQQVENESHSAIANPKIQIRISDGSVPPEYFLASLTQLDDNAHANNNNVYCQAKFCQALGTFLGRYAMEISIPAHSHAPVIVALTVDGKRSEGNTLVVTEKTSEIIADLVISPTRVLGFANQEGKGFAGAMAILVPEKPALHTDRFRRDQTDSDGSFTFNSVAPGRYTLLSISDAWTLEDGMELDWQNPEVIAPYMSQGVRVEIPEHAGEVFHLPATVPVQARIKTP